eukprot:894010-Rhodomonas_salina.1
MFVLLVTLLLPHVTANATHAWRAAVRIPRPCSPRISIAGLHAPRFGNLREGRGLSQRSQRLVGLFQGLSRAAGARARAPRAEGGVVPRAHALLLHLFPPHPRSLKTRAPARNFPHNPPPHHHVVKVIQQPRVFLESNFF